MELLANRPLVRVKVNGRGPFAFLVAPEAPATLIDASLASELKLKAESGRSAAPQFELQMEFGNSKVNVKASVSDMALVVPEFAPPARPRGIISASTWPNHLPAGFVVDAHGHVERGVKVMRRVQLFDRDRTKSCPWV